MAPIGRRYSSPQQNSCDSSSQKRNSLTNLNPSFVVYHPKIYANGIPPPPRTNSPLLPISKKSEAEEINNRRSSTDTVTSIISLLSIPPSILKEKRASLNSLQEHREEFLRKTSMLRKLSLADRPKPPPSTTKVSKQIRKFSLQVANGIQELFDENVYIFP
jgi:hypothetical protein